MLPKTVNKRVRDLEFQLGCAIFERHKRRVVPTRSGRVFLRHIAQLLQDFHTLVEAVRRMADGKAGQIAIGYHGSVAHGDLHRLLFDANPVYPDIHHLPVELSHDRLFEALASGRVDLAIVRGNPGDYHGLSAPLWNERIILCLPEAHPLADRTLLQWPDLVGETFLVSGYDPSDAIRKLLEDRFAPFEVSPLIAVHDISTSAVIHMVRAGHGICLCLESMMVDHYAGTTFRELSGAAGPEYVTSFACWQDDNPNPALKRLLIRLRRQYAGATSIESTITYSGGKS